MRSDYKDFFKLIFLTDVIGGCINTQRLELVNPQPLAIKLLLHEIYQVMSSTISTCLKLHFKKHSIWPKIILLSALMI